MGVTLPNVPTAAHGALNWDDELDANLAALATAINVATSISSTDLNGVTQSGVYSGNTLTNAPLGSATTFLLHVVGRDSNAAYQSATALNGIGTFRRTRSGGTWSAWSKVLDDSNGNYPIRQNGRVTLGASSADGSKFSATATVSFTSGLFTAAPIVMCNAESASPSVDVTMASSISATGFTIKHVRDVSFAGGAVIAWTAEAPTP